MTTPDRPPLWRAMSGAWSARVIAGRPDADRLATAAEIRAVRDWLVPEEEAPADFPGWLRYRERQFLRAQLTAEADRAERGDG